MTHYTLGKVLDYSSQVNETTRNFYDPTKSKGRSFSAQTANQVGDPGPGFEQSRTKWLNTTSFAIPANRTFGNNGRNILSGPWQANADVRLQLALRLAF